jgi:hypothetical protein
MKTALLAFVALVLSAQPLEVFRPDLPSEDFTSGRLNGLWYQRATPQERWVYIQAWQDITGRMMLHFPSIPPNELSPMPNILDAMSDPRYAGQPCPRP